MNDYIRDLQPAKWGSGVSLRGSDPEPLMSAMGQKRTLACPRRMSAIPPKADIAPCNYEYTLAVSADLNTDITTGLAVACVAIKSLVLKLLAELAFAADVLACAFRPRLPRSP
jgi:hypothetical protein